jgi:hypothetical protein
MCLLHLHADLLELINEKRDLSVLLVDLLVNRDDLSRLCRRLRVLTLLLIVVPLQY